MEKQHRSPQGWTTRTVAAHQEITLLLLGAAFLGSFIVIGMHVPAIYEAALAQMEESGGMEKTYDDTENQRKHIEQLRRNVGDRERELKNNFRGATIDVSEVNTLMAQWKTGIDELEGLIGGEEFWNRNQDFYYDHQQPVDEAFQRLYAQQSFQQIGRQIKDREQEAKNMERQIGDLRRNLKGSAGNTSALQGHIDGFKAKLEEIRRQYEGVSRDDPDLNDITQDIQDALNDLSYDHAQPLYDEINVLNKESNRANAKKEAERFLKDAKRFTEKDGPRQIKEFEKEGLDVSELKAILAEKQQLMKEVQALVSGDFVDPQDYWDLLNNDIDQRFWDIANGYSEEMNTKRQEKDAARIRKEKERTVKDMERELERAKDEGSLGAILRELKDILEQMRAALSEKDYDEFWSLNSDFDMRSGDFWNGLGESDMRQSRGDEIQGMEEMIRRFRQAIKEVQARGEMDDATAETCFGYADQADAILREAREAAVSGDGEVEEEIGQKMEPLGKKVEEDCAAAIKEMDSADSRAPRPYVEPELPTEDMFRHLGDQFATQLFEKVMQMKSDLLNEIASLEQRVQELRNLASAEEKRLADIQSSIAAHNFVSDAGEEAARKLGEFLEITDDLSSAEVQEELAKLEQEVKEAIWDDNEEAYEQDIIPFMDIPLDASTRWFIGPVALLKQWGWTKGTGDSGGRAYNPAGHLNIADTITFIGRAYGIDPNAIPSSRIGQDIPAYAWDAAGTLEGIGVPLDDIFAGNEAGDAVERAQIAHLLAATFRLPASDASFPDIGLATEEEREAIGAVNAAGWMTGQGNGAFGVKQKLNRAEMAAILARIRNASPIPVPQLEGASAEPEVMEEEETGEEATEVLEEQPPTTVEQQSPATPDSIMIRGRWISHFTQEPIGGAVIGTWDNQTRRSVTTDSNGAFAITADTTTIPKSFGSSPSCYAGLGFGLFRAADNNLSVNVNISAYIGPDRSFAIIGNEVHLGDIPFWPAVNLALTSDIPVKFRIESEKESGAGNSLYETEHGLTNAIPLMVPVRITVTDQSGTSTTSPSLTLPQDHGCTPVTLSFSQGVFTWK